MVYDGLPRSFYKYTYAHTKRKSVVKCVLTTAVTAVEKSKKKNEREPKINFMITRQQ